MANTLGSRNAESSYEALLEKSVKELQARVQSHQEALNKVVWHKNPHLIDLSVDDLSF
jgi:hypothetical protein